MDVGREAKVMRQTPSQKKDPVLRDKTSRLESTWHLESPLGDRQEKILSEKSLKSVSLFPFGLY